MRELLSSTPALHETGNCVVSAYAVPSVEPGYFCPPVTPVFPNHDTLSAKILCDLLERVAKLERQVEELSKAKP
jgi:hypothetical protein